MKFWKSKYFWWSIVGVFFWILFSDYMIHQQILKNAYTETSNMWRSSEDIQAHMLWLFVGQFAIAFGICWLFPFGYKKEGSWEGVRFGLWIGLFSCAHYFIQYAVTPMPWAMLWAWCLLTLAQCMAAGWIVWKVWQTNPRAMGWSKA